MKSDVGEKRFHRMIFRCLRAFAMLSLLCGAPMLLAAPPAMAFGCQAHEIIALIAEKHLSPHASDMVRQILKATPIDPAVKRYCQPPDFSAMAFSATWADDYRSLHRETAPWHQIDIPIGISEGNLMDFCPPSEGCVTQALKDQIVLLRSPETESQKRANALRFVIHFVGDLHAPLHTANNNDLGGNCIPVTFFGEAPKLANANYFYVPNLHELWDYAIYQRAFKDPNMQESATEYRSGFKVRTVQQSADEFDRQFASQEAAWMRGKIDIDAWTWESFRIAKTVVYGKLPVPVPVEQPAGNHSCSENDHISTRMLKLDEQIGWHYQKIALPVYEQQLAKAGARLALILNDIWP
jgi:S1/P1 Nuclease